MCQETLDLPMFLRLAILAGSVAVLVLRVM
jgi:hypothetical protein